MDRRQEIENIIIGTLLNECDNRTWYNDCKSCITPMMFQDKRNQEIYQTITTIKAKGQKDITPYDLILFSPKLQELAEYMCNLAIDFYFEIKKLRYNLTIKYAYRNDYTRVEFSDYVTKFIQLSFKKGKK